MKFQNNKARKNERKLSKSQFSLHKTKTVHSLKRVGVKLKEQEGGGGGLTWAK